MTPINANYFPISCWFPNIVVLQQQYMHTKTLDKLFQLDIIDLIAYVFIDTFLVTSYYHHTLNIIIIH